MGLLTKEVEVKLWGKNIPYYESLGYELPYRKDNEGRMAIPRGATIMVRVEDLRKNSNTPLEFVCDRCGKHIFRSFGTYNRCYHEDGVVYCRNCGKAVLNSGENHHCWNPLLTDKEREVGRDYPEYHDFIKRVLRRDNYQCVLCGSKDHISVHHLNGYHWCIEGRTDDDNAITLCQKHHNGFHNVCGMKDSTREQFMEWCGGVKIGEKYVGELPLRKKVVCLDTGIVFDSVDHAAERYGLLSGSVQAVCAHHANSLYGHHFMYLSEYESLNQKGA